MQFSCWRKLTLPIAFHSWVFIKQKEIDRSTSPAI
jgi:hypothetical protein